jgi:RNA 2',3'-cyclic 3'-phosphodiesterase
MRADAGDRQPAGARDREAADTRWRLFVGLPPPPAARDEIARRTAALRDVDRRARWVPATNMHVTLLFLGDRDPADVPAIAAAIGDVAAGLEPYRIELGEQGTFGGGRRGRTLWLRVERGAPETVGLMRELTRVLRTDMSEEQDSAVRPHLTLAREAGRELVERARQELSAIPAVGWTTASVHLYRSRLGQGPPIYEELAALPLGGRAHAA